MRIKELISVKILSSKYSLIGVILWILNDIYFKKLFHNDLTGKLSDIIGLFYTPLFFTATISLILIYLKCKVKESKILLFNILWVSTLFLCLNVDQKMNDYITQRIWFFYDSKGTADFTDIFCMFILIPLFLIFNKNYQSNVFENSIVLKYLNLILISFALVNTSGGSGNYETNERRLQLFTLLADTSDKIISINPLQGESFKISQSITFSWKYKNYYGITDPSHFDKDSECGITKELSELQMNNAGKFQRYLVQISVDEKFSSISAEFFSNGKEAESSGQLTVSGLNYYRIALQYKNKVDCKDQNFLIILPQEIKKLNINN
jgi:hypothetical protein